MTGDVLWQVQYENDNALISLWLQGILFILRTNI